MFEETWSKIGCVDADMKWPSIPVFRVILAFCLPLLLSRLADCMQAMPHDITSSALSMPSSSPRGMSYFPR